MLLVDDLAAGGTKNLRHTPRGLVTLIWSFECADPEGGQGVRTPPPWKITKI